MTSSNERRARQAGLIVTRRAHSRVYTCPLTGASVCEGNRSRKSWHDERRVTAFIRKREKLGLI